MAKAKSIGSHWKIKNTQLAHPAVSDLLEMKGTGGGEGFYERSIDFDAWLQYHFGKLLTLTPPAFQQEWIDEETQKRETRGRREWLCAFRGSAKTTIKGILMPLWRILEGLEHYVVWVSYTETQSYSRRHTVMDLIKRHESIINDYGQQAGSIDKLPWSRKQAITRSDIYLENYGIQSVPRGLLRNGKRPSLIILDDISIEKNQQTQLQRAKLSELINNVILKLGPADGSCNYICLSTPNHPEGIESEVKKQGSWQFREYPGLLAECVNGRYWDKWKKIYLDLRLRDERRTKAKEFYLKHQEKMDEGAKVAWPAMATYYDYQIEKLEKPGSFSKEIGLPFPIGFNPIDPFKQKLDTDNCALFRVRQNKIIITRGERLGEEIELSDIEDYGFLDPSVGEKITNDYAAIARVGIDSYGYKYLLELYCEITNKSRYLRHILEMNRRRPFTLFGFEGNGFQKYLSGEWEKIEVEAKRDGQRIRKLDYTFVYHSTKKILRIISSLQAPFANGHLAINEYIVNNKPIVWSQFLSLGTAENDDAPDATAGAVELINRYVGVV